MYKIGICDDDRKYRKTVKKTIEEAGILSTNEITFYEYGSGKELLKDADVLHELIFVDIRMPGLNGNETVLRLRETNQDAVLVFCSNYFEPTPDSINIGQPFRYIMKDLYDKSLKQEMPAILSKLKQCSSDHTVTVTSAGKIMRLQKEDILYICLAKRGCSIYVVDSGIATEIHSKETLSNLYEQLSDWGFEYAHNSYVVNLRKVEGVIKNVIYLQTGIQLNMSRSRKTQFTDALLKFLQDGGSML